MEVKESNDVNADNQMQQFIIYRSLYILKKKVDLYKPQLHRIYNKYSIKTNSNTNNPCLVSTNSLTEVVKELIEAIGISLIHIEHYNELFISNYLTNTDKQQSIKDIQCKFIKYIKEHITQYNTMLSNKRLNTLLKQTKAEAIKEQQLKHQIVQYNKHGQVIKSNETLIKENIDNAVLALEVNHEIVNEKRVNDKELYIETIPFIMADYIQINSNIAIIDTNEEFNAEIHSLFDKKIINQLKEESKPYQRLINPSDNYRRQLNELTKQKSEVSHSLSIYQNILIEKKKKGESTALIEDMIEKLIAQRIIVDSKLDELLKIQAQINLLKQKPKSNKSKSNLISISRSNRKLIEREDNKVLAIKDIFDFYSKDQQQPIPNGLYPIIELTQSKSTNANRTINLKSLIQFCKDFNISLNSDILSQIYKSNTSNNKPMSYIEFTSSLKDIAYLLHNTKKQYLWKTIEKVNETLTLMEQKELEREEEGKIDNQFTEKVTGIKQNKKGTIDKASIFYHNAHKQLTENVSKMKYDYECLSRKANDDILNDFYSNLGIFNSKEYRSKIEGYPIDKSQSNNTNISPNEHIFKLTNQLSKIKNSIENKELLLLLEKKKKDNDNDIKKQELLEKNKLYQIKMEHFLSDHKKLQSNSAKKVNNKQYDNINRKLFSSVALSPNEMHNRLNEGIMSLDEHNDKQHDSFEDNCNEGNISQYKKDTINNEVVLDNIKEDHLNADKHILSEDNISNRELLLSDKLISIQPHQPSTILKEDLIKANLRQSELKLKSLVNDSQLLGHHHNNSMIQIKQKENNLSTVNSHNSNHFPFVNKSFQVNSNQTTKHNKPNALFSAGEKIINSQLNSSKSQLMINLESINAQ